MRHSLTTTALAGTLVLATGCFLAGCAKTYIQPQYVPDDKGNAATVMLPDGSQLSMIYGGVRADPQNTQQRMDGGYVHTHWVDGKLRSDFDSRSTVSPSLALEAAQMVVPAAATLGAGALIDSGEHFAGQAVALGTYRGDAAIGKGLAAQKPTQIGISNVNGAYATGGSASATQSQSQSVPSSITIHQSSLP